MRETRCTFGCDACQEPPVSENLDSFKSRQTLNVGDKTYTTKTEAEGAMKTTKVCTE